MKTVMNSTTDNKHHIADIIQVKEMFIPLACNQIKVFEWNFVVNRDMHFSNFFTNSLITGVVIFFIWA